MQGEFLSSTELKEHNEDSDIKGERTINYIQVPSTYSYSLSFLIEKSPLEQDGQQATHF